MTVWMVVVGIAVFALAIVLVWFLVVRSTRAAAISESDFDAAYERLVRDGEPVDPDREAAWRDFDAWQEHNEEERLEWDDPPDV